MKQAVYGKFTQMRRNEAVMAFAITFAAIALYSAWGSYILNHQEEGISPQVVTVER